MTETPHESMDQDPRDKSVRDHEPPGDTSELQGSQTHTTGEGSGSFQDCSSVHQDEGNNLPWTEILRRRDKRRSARNLQKPDNVPEASTRESVRSNMAADTGKGGKNRVSPSASPKNPAKNGGSQTKRKPVAERLPPLPRDHYKVVIRPFDGLTLAEKAPQKMMNALATACGLKEQEGEDSTIRIRKDQNLMIFSTPDVGTAERMARVKHPSLNGQDYDIAAYIAAPDDSCRGVITKIGFGFSTEYLTKKIRPMGPEGPRVLNARMMGKSDAALITFQGIRVPRFVRFGMVECRCKPYFPKEQVCDVCLGLGHRRDVCPYPEQNKCSTCGLLNGDMEEHECSPYCIHYKGQHPSNDPKCPARKREPYNKGRLQDQQRAEEQQRGRQFKGTKEQQSQNNTDARQPLQPLQQWQRQLSPPTMTSQFHWPALESIVTTNPYALLANAGPESYAAALTQAPGWNPGNQHFYHGPTMGLPVPSEHGPAPGTSGKKKKKQKENQTDGTRSAGPGRSPGPHSNRQYRPRRAVEELVEAREIGQRTRLGRTRTGRALLRRLGYDGHLTRKEEESERKPAHPTIAAKIRTMPIPRNMHPIVHAGRRLARVRYLRRRYQDDPDVLYADAASYSTPISGRCIAVCGPNGVRRRSGGGGNSLSYN
ncbi:hypothetical protein HPB47_009739 [Ixodes persulcatus]|uniref:Uncharacterized protein n=1 Tax=Ixodes persulcatus TaxID=34615 RepID=A0AC60P1A7_IXOPE|nr:hypothetical protein HPB47_009739 [Ixodes persulcatus]